MKDSLLSVEQAQSALDSVISQATNLGASAAEAGLSSSGGLSIAVRNGELESIEHQQDKVLTLSTYRGQRKGTATTTDFSLKSLEETVAAADRIARYGEEDPFAGLIDPSYLATEIPDLDLDHQWEIDAESAIELAKTCDATARAVDARVDQVDDVSVNQHRGLRGYASSAGFNHAYYGTRHSMSCVVVGKGESGMQRGYWYSSARNANDIEAPEAIGARAGERTIAKLGATKIATETVPVIFEAPLAGGLIGHLVSAVSGGSLYRGASFLVDSAGKSIFPAHVNITEAPHLSGALGSAPFDSEGAKTCERKLIDAGVLTGYVLESYAARRLELAPTGNAGGVHNLIVSHADLNFDELVAQMGRGLIVTDLMGFGINLVTGDYSRGASGFWVEGGEIAYPVEEITIAGNLGEMFKHFVTSANDVDKRGNIRSGSILIESMTVAGA